MTDWMETNEGEEEFALLTFEEAKKEFEYWKELYEESLRDWAKEYRFKYKKGREPDVLAYLILSSDEKAKFRN